jgi:hypothetical protein
VFFSHLSRIAWPSPPATLWAHATGLQDAEYAVPMTLTGLDRDRLSCRIVAAGPSADGPEKDEPLLIVAPRFRRYACE